jgi:uncharacterized membrane protein (UPF0127 family)
VIVATLRNATTGEILARRVERAEGWWSRTLGLLTRARLSVEEGLWIDRCWAVHTVGMRVAIDLLFLDRDGRVLRMVCAAAPFRPGIACRNAAAVVELGAGALCGRDILHGDRLVLES